MSITILVGLDTVMAKRFFSPDVAGLYSGISIISNILFYATISVTGVLFSSVKRRQAATANRRILAISIALLLAVGVVGMIVFAVWPEFIISLLLGERYLPLAHILPYAGAAMLALSFTNLLMMYSIALDTKGVGIVSGIGTAIVIVTILISHKTIESLAVSFCIGNLLMLIICLVWMVFKHKQAKAAQ
jgi:O-antigen/teichoic acid export membrane protein